MLRVFLRDGPLIYRQVHWQRSRGIGASAARRRGLAASLRLAPISPLRFAIRPRAHGRGAPVEMTPLRDPETSFGNCAS